MFFGHPPATAPSRKAPPRFTVEPCCLSEEHDAWLVTEVYGSEHKIESVWHLEAAARARAQELNAHPERALTASVYPVRTAKPTSV